MCWHPIFLVFFWENAQIVTSQQRANASKIDRERERWMDASIERKRAGGGRGGRGMSAWGSVAGRQPNALCCPVSLKPCEVWETDIRLSWSLADDRVRSGAFQPWVGAKKRSLKNSYMRWSMRFYGDFRARMYEIGQLVTLQLVLGRESWWRKRQGQPFQDVPVSEVALIPCHVLTSPGRRIRPLPVG